MFSYKYYSDVYGGKMIKEEDFKSCSRKAVAIISYLTMYDLSDQLNALDDETENPLFNCVCRIMETQAKSGESYGIKSESTDGYSVTYGDNHEQSQVMNDIQMYLSNLGLTYAGVTGRNVKL